MLPTVKPSHLSKKIPCYNARISYEGYPTWQTVHLLRTAIRAGCKRVILTNAAGGLIENYVPGDLVVLSDLLLIQFRLNLGNGIFIPLVIRKSFA